MSKALEKLVAKVKTLIRKRYLWCNINSRLLLILAHFHSSLLRSKHFCGNKMGARKVPTRNARLMSLNKENKPTVVHKTLIGVQHRWGESE